MPAEERLPPGTPATSWESIRITLPATTLSMWRHSRCARNPGSKGKVCRELKGYHSAGSGRGWPWGLWRLFHTRGCTDQGEHTPEHTPVCTRKVRTVVQRGVELQHGHNLLARLNRLRQQAGVQGRHNLHQWAKELGGSRCHSL